MSIAIVTQVYDEMRRLAIAGSVVAGGDFRLKKLIPGLEQAGAKAPVFAKVAESVKKVVDSKEQDSASSLLDLATLVNAILYTQGETGMAGTLEPIETTDLGAPTAQASAKVLKPLLEALTTTGSGRLELIKDACERGAFRDLRLVKPALAAIDDVYGEIGDLIAEKVLPMYGQAIVPELRATLDLKGRAGHPRRIRLLHALDSAGSRDLVKQALDDGSKEVKVAAIECLGAAPEDLSYLLEQAKAKAQEVRQAAYRALAGIDDEQAVAVLQKAMTGKDLELAADSLRKSRNAKLLGYVIAGAQTELAELPKTKDKKDISTRVQRLQALIGCLYGRQDAASEDFLLATFAQRNDLAKIKGAAASGSDLNAGVIRLLEVGTPKMQRALAEAHADLNGEYLDSCFRAARRCLSAAAVFEQFSPYLTAKVDDKKKQRDPAWAKRAFISEAIGGEYYYWSNRQDKEPPLDERWLDIAVAAKDLRLVRQLVRPGSTAAHPLLTASLAEVLKKSKSLDDCQEVVASMVYSAHPDATDAFVAAVEKHAKKADYGIYWFGRLIVDMPKASLPMLEALVPKLSDNVADRLLDYIQQLRDRK